MAGESIPTFGMTGSSPVRMNCSRIVSLACCALLLGNAGLLAAAEPEPERIVMLNQYLASIKEQRWADALPPAQRLLEMARQENPRSPQMIEALTRVGGVQFALREYDNAEVAFVAAIQLAEKTTGPLDQALEEPLRGLGYTLGAMDRHAQAVPVLERALLLSQRHNGLFDMSQRGLRQQLGNSLSELQRYTEAEQQYRFILQTAEQAFGQDDIRAAETIDLVADWYTRWNYMEVGRELYRRAIGLLETKGGPVDARLIDPLRSLARSYTRELLFASVGRAPINADGTAGQIVRRNRLAAEGEEALLRALTVMEATGRQGTLPHRQALIDTGDWYMLKGSEEKALEYYRRALQQPVAAANVSATAAAGDPLSYPALLDYLYPPVARRFTDRPQDKVNERHLVMEFTVTSKGTVRDLRIVESDATERMQRETLASMREALYRPRFENGEPLDTPNVRHQQTFRELKN